MLPCLTSAWHRVWTNWYSATKKAASQPTSGRRALRLAREKGNVVHDCRVRCRAPGLYVVVKSPVMSICSRTVPRWQALAAQAIRPAHRAGHILAQVDQRVNRNASSSDPQAPVWCTRVHLASGARLATGAAGAGVALLMYFSCSCVAQYSVAKRDSARVNYPQWRMVKNGCTRNA